MVAVDTKRNSPQHAARPAKERPNNLTRCTVTIKWRRICNQFGSGFFYCFNGGGTERFVNLKKWTKPRTQEDKQKFKMDAPRNWTLPFSWIFSRIFRLNESRTNQNVTQNYTNYKVLPIIPLWAIYTYIYIVHPAHSAHPWIADVNWFKGISCNIHKHIDIECGKFTKSTIDETCIVTALCRLFIIE